ncbi:MAG: sodium:solute symporter family protein [Bdellovibrionales bacterium]|nr:sodium:solute symporter family protein [Bdellovibrionales bacterium]
MNTTSFTILILILYLIALKLVSVAAYKKSQNTTEDYFLASRGVGFLALIATTIASVFSTGTVVAAPSEFYTKGGQYFFFLWFTWICFTMALLGLKIWKLGKAKNFITPGELLADFYQSKRVHIISALIGLLSLVPYAVAQLVAIGKTFEALTAGTVNYQLGIIIVCVAMGLYLYYGGSRAVIWTDMIQGVIFCSLLITSAGLILYWAGGWNNVTQNLLNNYPDKAIVSNSDVKYFEMFLLPLSFLFLPHIWQRLYMAKSAATLSKNIMIIPFVVSILFFSTWVIGTSGLVLFPNGLADGDALLGAIFKTNAPYFGAFVLVAAFAAGMSTIDSQLLSSGAIITRDLRPIFNALVFKNKKLEAVPDYAFARTVTILLLLFAFVWSLTLKSTSVFSLIILGMSIAVVLMPCVLGLFFWKKSTEAGAFWSMTIGLLVFLIKQFTSYGDYFPTKLGGVSWALITASCIFIISGLLSQKSNLSDKIEEYKKILFFKDL